jgi:hypothetical protein
MINLSSPQPDRVHTGPRIVQTLPHDDDDDDDAACDDDDDGISPARHDGWFSQSGFGSPEWWSRR